VNPNFAQFLGKEGGSTVPERGVTIYGPAKFGEGKKKGKSHYSTRGRRGPSRRQKRGDRGPRASKQTKKREREQNPSWHGRAKENLFVRNEKKRKVGVPQPLCGKRKKRGAILGGRKEDKGNLSSNAKSKRRKGAPPPPLVLKEKGKKKEDDEKTAPPSRPPAIVQGKRKKKGGFFFLQCAQVPKKGKPGMHARIVWEKKKG